MARGVWLQCIFVSVETKKEKESTEITSTIPTQKSKDASGTEDKTQKNRQIPHLTDATCVRTSLTPIVRRDIFPPLFRTIPTYLSMYQ